MRLVLDTSVLIDHLRGNAHATALLEEGFSSAGRLAGSVLTKLEVLAGMRDEEEQATRALLGLGELGLARPGLSADQQRAHSGAASCPLTPVSRWSTCWWRPLRSTSMRR